MPTLDRADFEQLLVQIEQDLLLQAQHFGALLVANNPALAAHYQRKLRTVTARIKRPRPVKGVRAPH